jgi:predicted amidohydrolase
MQNVRVALAQLAPKLGDLQANLEIHLSLIADANDRDADLIVFPELSLTGYLLQDQVPEVSVTEGDAVVSRLAGASRSTDIVVGMVEETSAHRFHNVAAYFSGGRLLHTHRKIYLPTYGMFQEGRDFAAGEQLRCFDSPFGRWGLLLCEDLWHPSCAWILSQQGAEAIIVLSNGPTRGAKPGQEITSVEVWRRLVQVTAQLQTVFMVYVNRVGFEDGLCFGGGSVVVDPLGRVIDGLPALEPGLQVVELDRELLRRARSAYPMLADENLDLVSRELERIRRLRYDLPAGPAPAVNENRTARASGAGREGAER